MKSLSIFAALVLPSLLLGSLGGCTVNPATGAQTFTGGLSTAQEIKIGREQHPKIIKQFGGEYGSPDMRRYVESLGQLAKLVAGVHADLVIELAVADLMHAALQLPHLRRRNK